MSTIVKQNPKERCTLEKATEITHYSSFSSPSFYLCLGAGILEIIARFKPMKNIIGPLLGNIQKHKEKTMEFAGENSEFVTYFYEIIRLISEQATSTSQAFGWLSDFLVGDDNSYAYSVQLSTQCLFASIFGPEKGDKIEQVMSGQSIKSIEFVLLTLIAETFGIQIIVHRGNDKETYSKPSLGIYPIMMVFIGGDEYSLLYSDPMIEIEISTNFEVSQLSKYPFVFNNKPFNSPHPIMSDPQKNILIEQKGPPIPSDYNSLSRSLIAKLASELMKREIPQELLFFVQQACSSNSDIAAIDEVNSLARSISIPSTGMNNHTVCVKCNNPKGVNSFNQFVCHEKCKICDVCRRVSTLACVGCKRSYSQAENKYLESINRSGK